LDRTWSKEVSNSDEEQLPDVDALTHMGKLLRLEVVHGTNIVKITASSADPQETADIANAMAIRYKAMRDAEADLSETQGEDSLREQIAQQQKVVDERKAALEKMRQDLSIKGIYIPVGERVTEIEKADAELDARRKDLLNAQEDSNAREVLLKSVINLPDDQFISQVVDGLHGQGRENEIDTLRADISKNETEIANLLKASAKENDPRIVALRQEDDAKRKQLHDLVSGLRRAMQIDADMSKARVALLQKEVDGLTQKVRGNSLKALEPYRAAQRELDQQQTILDGLNARLKQMEADRPITQRPVRILARAQVPEVPSQPDRHFDFIVTILTASFLSVSIASFFEIIFMFLRAGERMDN
jgi:succinoglycan biosynthesis transport protein ExoP